MDLNSPINKSQVFRAILNTLNHMLVGIITYHMLWFCLYANYTNPFSWHVALCTIGYVFLMAESILIFSNDNSWTRMLPRHSKKTLHWVLQGVGSILCIAGIAIEINLKTQRNRPHFKSNHGIIGLVALILLIISCFGGVPALYAARLKNTVKPVLLKLIHNLLGMSAFILGMVAYILGYYTNYFARQTSDELRIFLITCTVLLIILSLFNSLRSAYSQIRS